MPDLGNISHLTLRRCPAIKTLSPPPPSDNIQSDSTSASVKTLVKDCNWDRFPVFNGNNGHSIRVLRRSRGPGGAKKGNNGKSLDDLVSAWVQKKKDSGVSQSRCFLPFLVASKKIVECLLCHSFVFPGEEVLCSIRNCDTVYHLTCAKEKLRLLNPKKFKCPQHACFICKQKFHWRCVRCSIAAHDKCGPWPDKVIHLIDKQGRAVCWRHPSNWQLDKKDKLTDSEVMTRDIRTKCLNSDLISWLTGLMYLLNEQHMVPTCDIEEVFCRLPLPYVDEEFNIDLTWKDEMENKLEPPPYVHIRRNVYLVKKKRDDADNDVGCTNCSSTCCEDCVCRVQCISCSRACHCPENCTNRPFRKEKKIKIVKTEFCGWGVEAAEPISKGDFIVEYIGEVIDDKLCEQRLWDMKYKGVQNFYMCEIRKDFTIDATFKGNASRFLNHSCDPNCILEKWQVEGETRVGVFAARSIKVGDPLTYDYRFVQFGPEVKCQCGALNCHGYLGTKRKIVKLNLCCWGAKRRRSSTACLSVVTV